LPPGARDGIIAPSIFAARFRPMRLLVFQHIAIEHPGIFRDFLAADGVAWDAVELDAGEPIPPLSGYDALWVMGGPMDVWQEEQHPWLVAEKRAIREAVIERGMPYLGVCLGHQLLGAALGGRVGPMTRAEVGILDVELTAAGRRDPLFAGLAQRFKALQWHGAEVAEIPPGATVLAGSPACAVQAIRVGASAYGLQYHVELTDRTVAEWADVPAYARALDATLGAGALPGFATAAAASMSGFNRDARLLYDNFMRLIRRRAA
jgi:GMP synthase-like glutamine amidotransferase